jgi:hypothetical protein
LYLPASHAPHCLVAETLFQHAYLSLDVGEFPEVLRHDEVRLLNMRDGVERLAVAAGTLVVLKHALHVKNVQGSDAILRTAGTLLLGDTATARLRHSDHAQRVDAVVLGLPLDMPAATCTFVRHSLHTTAHGAAPVVVLVAARLRQMMADAFTSLTTFPSVMMSGAVFAVVRPALHAYIGVIRDVKRVAIAVHDTTLQRLILREALALQALAREGAGVCGGGGGGGGGAQ